MACANAQAVYCQRGGGKELWGHVRVLVNEAGAVVDLVVNDHVQVLLGVVGGNLLEGEFLGLGHAGRLGPGATASQAR